MFDKFVVLMTWKLSWGLAFLLFGVSDGHIFFDFSNYCPNIITYKNWYVKKDCTIAYPRFLTTVQEGAIVGTVLEMPCWSSGSVHNQTFQIRYAPIPSNTLAFNFYWGALVGRRGTWKWSWSICEVGSNRISIRWEGSTRPPTNQLMKKWEVQNPNIENY